MVFSVKMFWKQKFEARNLISPQIGKTKSVYSNFGGSNPSFSPKIEN
jgi:hypothetical protein